MSRSTSPPRAHPIPSLTEIRDKTQTVFGRRPCLWQAKVAEAFLKRDQDILCIAGTGKGKTLTFWMPLLFDKTSIQIVITPLNLLGKQNVESLEKAGIHAISIHAGTATAQNFQAIENLEYRVIVVSPEQVMKDGGGFERLFKNPLFTSHIMGIVIDEAHCVSTWGEFRPEYKELGRLRLILPLEIPFLVTSATLSADALQDVKKLLHLRSCDKLVTIRRSTDRPNIHITVKPIRGTLHSYADLAFLIPDRWKAGDSLPPKFLIFFDNITHAIEAAQCLRSRLPPEYREKIKWFNSDMTTHFKEAEVENFSNGETWGFCMTESFGMGVDISDVRIVIQWRAMCSLSTLWQRFGRAVRDMTLEGIAILFAEKDHFDAYRKEKEQRRLQRAKKRKKTSAPLPSAKRRAIADSSAPAVVGGSTVGLVDVPPVEHQDSDGSDSSDGEIEVVSRSCLLRPSSENAGMDGRQLREEMRSTNKGKTNVSQRKTSQPQITSLEPAMDYLINADVRPGVGCRRKVFNAFFENEAAETDHRLCNSTLETGCPRCLISHSTICCDIHTPEHFTSFTVPIPTQTKLPSRSRLAKFEMSSNDFRLVDALEDWREAATTALYGTAHLYDLGPGLVMPDFVLDRIVQCAHFFKIQSAADLQKETRWSGAEKHGNEVVALILRVCPAPVILSTPFTSAPLQRLGPGHSASVNPVAPTTLNRSTPVAGTVKRRNWCSACKQEGHNARNTICKEHPSRKSLGNKENVPSLPPSV
ncbi:P-loop containing nucleoside triphosphate hydrolase protein [Leucogyrophana mollusca]|uniref:P-loop containing nucleoside triphosphate hydrolase protein n=1 Tax=Leucogyrophana mollusca TaxID=85980 RepID=A0ACB8AWG9_9AGAM|nr:P-loop containing nucleoside triphosphate hydrolase protein [Leucogyrophana mollusca]